MIGQFPNAPLWIFAAASAAGWLAAPGGRAAQAATWVARASLVWWAVDELVRGVNPWRRLLGAGVLALEVGLVLSGR